jgi:hypothetical protein
VFEECSAGENAGAGKARNLVIQFQVRLRSDRAAELLGSRLKVRVATRVKRVPLITTRNLSTWCTINGLNIVTSTAIYLGPGTA